MPADKPTGYWLITVKVEDCSGYSTLPIKQHPVDYMAKNLRDETLVFAMPITKRQYDKFDKAYRV